MADFTGSNTPAEQRDSWRTPPELFAALNAEFIFQLDAAATEENRLCRLFISEEENTLTKSWPEAMGYAEGYVWLNPPYSDISPFVEKAANENKWGSIGCVMLLPADTSVGWFRLAIETASEVRFITSGRLAFINPVTRKPVSGNNKGSMLIIWHPYPRTHCHFATVNRDELMAFGAKVLDIRERKSSASQDTVWPAEVSLVYSQLEIAGSLPEHHQRRLHHHINRMWLEKMPVPKIIEAAISLATSMERTT